MKCERLEQSIDADPYRTLAIAVLQRAVDDACGRRMRFKGSELGRKKLSEEALQFLLDGAGGLTAFFDIDHGSMLAALGLQEG